MHTIMHSELRNNSASILRAVENGESYGVTNHGRLVAMIVPIKESPYENLLRRGKIRLPDTVCCEITRRHSPGDGEAPG